MQRPLPDNTQQSQGKIFTLLGEIRTRSLNKRAAADQQLRPLCHSDLLLLLLLLLMMMMMMMITVGLSRSRFSMYCYRLACSLYSQYFLC